MGAKAATGLVDLWVDSGPVLQEKAFHTVRWFESEKSLEMCSRQKHYTIQTLKIHKATTVIPAYIICWYLQLS